LSQRHGFAMRTPARLGPAAPDNDAIFYENTADSRVRPGITKTAPR